MYHANMEEANKENYRTVIVVLKGEVSASNRLEAINILAVQYYYYAQENDCDEQAVHEIADGISAGSFRYQAKTQLYRKLLLCIYAIFTMSESRTRQEQ